MATTGSTRSLAAAAREISESCSRNSVVQSWVLSDPVSPPRFPGDACVRRAERRLAMAIAKDEVVSVGLVWTTAALIPRLWKGAGWPGGRLTP